VGRWEDERLTELVSQLVGLNVGLLATHGVVATIAARNASPRFRSSVSTAAISCQLALSRASRAPAET
jgi:hypothetical protein